jgi:hypothetical protein
LYNLDLAGVHRVVLVDSDGVRVATSEIEVVAGERTYASLCRFLANTVCRLYTHLKPVEEAHELRGTSGAFGTQSQFNWLFDFGPCRDCPEDSTAVVTLFRGESERVVQCADLELYFGQGWSPERPGFFAHDCGRPGG